MAVGTVLPDDNDKPTAIGTYVNITGTGNTVIKTLPGFLYSITFNTVVATGVITIFDNTTATGTKIGTITIPANPQPSTIFFNLSFLVGCSISVATATQDLTVVYR